MSYLVMSQARPLRHVYITLLLAALVPGMASANLMINPKRLVLEDGRRTGQVSVMNTGSEPITLRISLVNQAMKADGSLHPVEREQAVLPADRLLRYAPRRLELAPGRSQIVRLVSFDLSRLDEGEYRSHLLFRQEPTDLSVPEPPARRKPRAGTGVQLIPIMGISIPVIVRSGNLQATADISDIRLQRDEHGRTHARFELHRTGTRSLFGDAEVYFRPPGGSDHLIGVVRGVAIYTSLARRTVRVPLELEQGQSLPSGTLRVEYRTRDSRRRLLAEGSHEM